MKKSDIATVQGIGFGLLANTSDTDFAKILFGIAATVLFLIVILLYAEERKE